LRNVDVDGSDAFSEVDCGSWNLDVNRNHSFDVVNNWSGDFNSHWNRSFLDAWLGNVHRDCNWSDYWGWNWYWNLAGSTTSVDWGARIARSTLSLNSLSRGEEGSEYESRSSHILILDKKKFLKIKNF
jgi:hypothetical protein